MAQTSSVQEDNEMVIECAKCNRLLVSNICSDRTRCCEGCGSEMKGINAFRDFRQRVAYYRCALEHCMKMNPLLLPFLCPMIASYCAEPPRFGVGQKVDFYDEGKKYWIKSKVTEIKYDVTEQVLIAKSQENGSSSSWMNAHDEKLKSLDIFRPDSKADIIDVLCGKCGIVLYEELHPVEYVVAEPTQPHFSFEMFTDKAPEQNNISKLRGRSTQLNCKRNCHAPLWLIDHQSGYINLHGHQYGLACGRTYAVARLSANGTSEKKEVSGLEDYEMILIE